MLVNSAAVLSLLSPGFSEVASSKSWPANSTIGIGYDESGNLIATIEFQTLISIPLLSAPEIRNGQYEKLFPDRAQNAADYLHRTLKRAWIPE